MMATALPNSITMGDSPDPKFRKHTALAEIEETPFHTSRGGYSTHEISPNVPATPASYIQPSWYHDMDNVIKNVDQYFLDRWSFPSEKARKRFVSSGFARVTCMYFPTALDDRIEFACKLLTIFFLIDDLLEDMSFEEGEAFNASLMPIMRGVKQPDRSIPVQSIMWDIWEEMRTCDQELASDILEPMFDFMRAQTEKTRKHIKGVGPYLLYRERDVGNTVLSAVMRFLMDIRLTPEELLLVGPIDKNCSRHITVVNDIFSWEKELAKSCAGHDEGSFLCSSVKILADEGSLTTEASKRVLFAMVREWELIHLKLAEEIRRDKRVADDRKEVIVSYIKGLEYQMSGNEYWSARTLRYIGVESD